MSNRYLQLAQDCDKFPNDLTNDVEGRITLLYRKMAYLEANKWLKDNDHISKYKGRRELSAFQGNGWNKVTWNIIKPFFKDALEDLPLLATLKKAGPTRVCLYFDDGAGTGLRWGGTGRVNRDNWISGLRDEIQAATLPIGLSVDLRDASWKGTCKVFLDYNKINLLSVQPDRLTLPQLKAAITEAKILLLPLMERRNPNANTNP